MDGSTSRVCYALHMPMINVFYADELYPQQLGSITAALKDFAAKSLTCHDIALRPDEISVRLLQATGDGMLAEIEVEVTAHAFRERIERQDEICLEIREFLKSKLTAPDVRVWLLLPELGHSWE